MAVPAATILLVEDNEDHVELLRLALVRAHMQNPLQVVGDGDEAIAYLSGQGKYAGRAEYPMPELVLLDLKLPRRNGFEVLRWIRERAEFQSLPVIVLTSSEEVWDLRRAYALGANSFLVKPVEFPQFVALMQSIKSAWFSPGAAGATSDPQETQAAGM